jgi:predicted RNase H-like HicB family nuclease
MSNLRKQAEAMANRGYSETGFLDSTTENEYVYVAISPELAGCLGQDETLPEALENLRLFRVDYMQHLFENNLPIPNPI